MAQFGGVHKTILFLVEDTEPLDEVIYDGRLTILADRYVYW